LAAVGRVMRRRRRTDARAVPVPGASIARCFRRFLLRSRSFVAFLANSHIVAHPAPPASVSRRRMLRDTDETNAANKVPFHAARRLSLKSVPSPTDGASARRALSPSVATGVFHIRTPSSNGQLVSWSISYRTFPTRPAARCPRPRPRSETCAMQPASAPATAPAPRPRLAQPRPRPHPHAEPARLRLAPSAPRPATAPAPRLRPRPALRPLTPAAFALARSGPLSPYRTGCSQKVYVRSDAHVDERSHAVTANPTSIFCTRPPLPTPPTRWVFAHQCGTETETISFTWPQSLSPSQGRRVVARLGSGVVGMVRFSGGFPSPSGAVGKWQ
jgi:hypothetical protein